MLIKNLENESGVNEIQIWRNHETHYINALSNPWYHSLFRLQSDIALHTHNFFNLKKFSAALLPITTGSVSSPMGLGSDSLPVQVSISNITTYLADSMQFMLEYALRFYSGGVYYLMPSFRGESADQRHLCQFYHIEAEICGDLGDVINLVNEYLYYLTSKLFENSHDVLNGMTNDLTHINKFIDLKGKIPQIRFDEAVHYLLDKPGCLDKHEAGFLKVTDLGEKELIELYQGPVWLTHFPKLSVPFYQADEFNSPYSMSADLLMGIGETVGSGQRHLNCEEVLKALDERQVSLDKYEWYLKLREISPVQTSGFGMGLERFILWLTNHNDIRDCQIIPRFNGIDIIP